MPNHVRSDSVHSVSASNHSRLAQGQRPEHLWSDVNEVRIHTTIVGVGFPVVLVHGYGVSGRYMLPLAQALAPRFSVLVPDLPGHGRSQRARVAPGIEAHAETLADWLAALGLERPAIVANSMGCQIVTKLAARHPERVDPIVLTGPTVRSGPAPGTEPDLRGTPRDGTRTRTPGRARDKRRRRPGDPSLLAVAALARGPHRGPVAVD